MSGCWSCSGRLFHSVGPVLAKQRSPNWLRDLLISYYYHAACVNIVLVVVVVVVICDCLCVQHCLMSSVYSCLFTVQCTLRSRPLSSRRPSERLVFTRLLETAMLPQRSTLHLDRSVSLHMSVWKSSMYTNRKSTASFPVSLRWTVYVALKPLKGVLRAT